MKMTFIKPAYLNIQELGEDSLHALEDYLNGLNFEEWELTEIIKLAPSLIEIFQITYTDKLTRDKDPLMNRVNSTSLALISDCMALIDEFRFRKELVSNNTYCGAIKIYGRLKRVVDGITKKQDPIELDPTLTCDDFASIGLLEK